MAAITMIIYVGLVWPFNTAFGNLIEIFNEIMNLIMLYHMITFSPFVPDPAIRYQMGISQMVCFAAWLCIHFFFWFKDMFGKAKDYAKKRIHKWRSSKIKTKSKKEMLNLRKDNVPRAKEKIDVY